MKLNELNKFKTKGKIQKYTINNAYKKKILGSIPCKN